jgi:STE24 endopeptidase
MEESMSKGWILAALLVLLCAVSGSSTAYAQGGPAAAPVANVDVHSLPPAGVANFDPQKATNAYLARISGKARSQSDSYFEGGYVLTGVDALYAIAVSALLLWLGISARMRDIAARMTGIRFFQVPIYVVQYIVVTTILSLPLAIYEGFTREHAYGLSNQNFSQWAGDFAIGVGVNLVALTILATLIYSVIRASKRYWWAWGTGVSIVFFVIVVMLSPVFIAPLFNHYQPLKEGPLKQGILSLARSEGIPATNVYEFDASKQTKRISANVSGFAGTTRISLNDNLLNRSNEREILAVLGHEMGHYVLDHAIRLILMEGLLYLVAFGFVAWAFGFFQRAFGARWGVSGVDDPAGLPILVALATFFFLVATPVENTISRTTEAQADIFGVNAARQPDGFAEATLQLSEYRKLDPSPLEEFVFYDHPSGRSRISMMMRWKAEHLNDPDIKAGPISPQ